MDCSQDSDGLDDDVKAHGLQSGQRRLDDDAKRMDCSQDGDGSTTTSKHGGPTASTTTSKL